MASFSLQHELSTDLSEPVQQDSTHGGGEVGLQQDPTVRVERLQVVAGEEFSEGVRVGRLPKGRSGGKALATFQSRPSPDPGFAVWMKLHIDIQLS